MKIQHVFCVAFLSIRVCGLVGNGVAGWDSKSPQQNDVRSLAKVGNSHEFRGLSSQRGLLKIEWLLPRAAVSRLP